LAGGALIVGGTLIVSLRFGRGAGTFKLRLVMLMLACGLALAVSGLIFKVFAITVEFWVTTFWLFVGEALFGCAILAIGVYRRQFVAVLSKHPAALLTISGANEVLNLAGALGFRYALLFAPLSIVQAIGATTTLFVFGFGVACRNSRRPIVNVLRSQFMAMRGNEDSDLFDEAQARCRKQC
jgi:hypothetical protein